MSSHVFDDFRPQLWRRNFGLRSCGLKSSKTWEPKWQRDSLSGTGTIPYSYVGSVSMDSRTGSMLLWISQSIHRVCRGALSPPGAVGWWNFQAIKRHWKTQGHVALAGLRIEDATRRSFTWSDSINEAGAAANSSGRQNRGPRSRTNWRAAIPLEAEGSRCKEVKVHMGLLCWFLWCRRFGHSDSFVCWTQAGCKTNQSIRPWAVAWVLAWQQIRRMAASTSWELCLTGLHWPRDF